MGITKGGILVPSPLAYDYELDPTGQALDSPKCSSTSQIRIVTRVPSNPSIDDFDAFYAILTQSGGSVNFTITVTNLRTSLVIATSVQAVTLAAYRSYRYAFAKDNPFSPGDFIEILFTWNSGAELRLYTWQKGGFFSSLSVGQAFPFAGDTASSRFQAPAIFFTWLDADSNAITEWMPGLLPAHAIGGVTLATRYFVGNLIEMPFTDRRPSGVWFSSYSAHTGATVRIYAEPTSPTDFTELYSIVYPVVSGSLLKKLVYLPFDGDQPVLVRGNRYIVGLGSSGAPAISNIVRTNTWLKHQIGPAWSVDPVQYGFSLMTELRRVTTPGTWDEVPSENYDLGLVFEESET